MSYTAPVCFTFLSVASALQAPAAAACCCFPLLSGLEKPKMKGYYFQKEIKTEFIHTRSSWVFAELGYHFLQKPRQSSWVFEELGSVVLSNLSGCGR